MNIRDVLKELESMGTAQKKLRSERKAIEVANRIGKVEVDHGETNCKTPDAITYIRKAVEHRRRKKSVNT